jgi:hypothetical protein
VFGSGGRRRDGGVTFVSAGSTVDRLQFAVRDACTFVSNSLVCLLEAIDARLDTSFRGYDELFETITLGFDHAVRDVPLLGGGARLIYHHNLRWDGAQLRVAPKPAPRRHFDGFADYTGFVRGALHQLDGNMASPGRTWPLSWLGTISRGYDSATSAALAREAGLRRVITHDESRPGERDDGLAVAQALNLDCVLVDRLAWRKSPAPLEPLFLAADAQGKEIMVAGTAAELERTVLVTGHGGDTAWSTRSPAGTDLARGSHSGLSMTEYRLHAGFAHVPVPFIGLRQLPDLMKLSQSPEMAEWDLGGGYSRPVCRRILEEAGVPRGSFGTSKTGASNRFLRGDDPWSSRGKRAFFAWLHVRRHDYGIRRPALLEVRGLILGIEMALLLSRHAPKVFGRRFQSVARALARRLKERGVRDLAFAWAIDTVRSAYRVTPERKGEAT